MRAASLLLLTATYAQQQRIAIYVLSTGKSKRLNGTHTEPLHWLTQRALPALDTWAKGFDRVVFVVEKGFEGSAAGRGCLVEVNSETDFVARNALSASPCTCLLYTSPSPRDATLSRMPSSA